VDRLDAAAMRAEVERRLAGQRQALTATAAGGSSAGGKGDRPYLLFLVRPDGITSYYLALGAVNGLNPDFGYEFIDRDWLLDFSEDSTNVPAWITADSSATQPAPSPGGRQQPAATGAPSPGQNSGPHPASGGHASPGDAPPGDLTSPPGETEFTLKPARPAEPPTPFGAGGATAPPGSGAMPGPGGLAAPTPFTPAVPRGSAAVAGDGTGRAVPAPSSPGPPAPAAAAPAAPPGPAGSGGGPGTGGTATSSGTSMPPGITVAPGEPRSRPVVPPRFISDRDWVLSIECQADAVLIYPGGTRLAPAALLRRTEGRQQLVETIQQMVAHKQATVRPGEPPYRPQIRFLVRPDGLRTFYLAYPVLDGLHLPMTRQNLGADEEVK